MKKQTKVLLATALLTLGASFTSMAATYDWQMVDGEWMCFDEDGVEYTDAFCKYEGDEFYVNEEGVLEGLRWVDDTYYVDFYGRKTKNEWVYTVTDDNEDENWYYFGSKGVLATNDKITWKNETYFVGEDGGLLTGWVEYTKADKGENGAEDIDEAARAIEEGEDFDWTKTYYTDENGALITSDWINVTAPAADEDDDTTYDYYLNEYGRPVKGKKTIGGLTYFFGTDRTMLSGGVGKTGGNYVEAWDDGNDYSLADLADFDEVYFCGDAEQGYAKKDRWTHTVRMQKFRIHSCTYSKITENFTCRAAYLPLQLMS